MIKKTILLVALLLPLTAAAQAPQHYRVLLPVFFDDPVPGAYGSQWKTAYAANNPTPYSFHVDWCPGSSNPIYDACSRPLFGNAHLAPGDTETTLPDFSHDFNVLQQRGGPRLLYIRPFDNPPNAAPNPAGLSFALRAFDVSRSATNAGTEVPVVRQEQFRKSTTNLLNVPNDPNFRLTLRIYETKLKEAAFRIRVYDQATNAQVGERTMVVSWHFPHHYKLMFEPPHLQIGDLGQLIPLDAPRPPTLRIELTPLTADSEFWGFVSITNNDTQHLTLVTPQ